MTDRYESRATTHAADCWSWGPRHYECAVREIKALRMDFALLRIDRDSWEQRALRAEARVAELEADATRQQENGDERS